MLTEHYQKLYPDRFEMYHKLNLHYLVQKHELKTKLVNKVRQKLSTFFVVATKLPERLFHLFPFLARDTYTRKALLTVVHVPPSVVDEYVEQATYAEMKGYLVSTREWIQRLVELGPEVNCHCYQ